MWNLCPQDIDDLITDYPAGIIPEKSFCRVVNKIFPGVENFYHHIPDKIIGFSGTEILHTAVHNKRTVSFIKNLP